MDKLKRHLEVLKDLIQARGVTFIEKQTASFVSIDQYKEALTFFIGVGDE